AMLRISCVITIGLFIISPGCKSNAKKEPAADLPRDTIVQNKADSNISGTHDPVQTENDTAMLSAAMEEIRSYPEVRAIDQQIRKNSNDKHSVAIMVQNSFGSDS